MAFPILSRNPISVDKQHEFAIISTPFDGGYEQTRRRHNRDRETLVAKYILERSDLDLLLAHWDEVNGSVSFDWADPDTLTVYTVRYTKAPKYTASGAWPDRYDISLEMRVV